MATILVIRFSSLGDVAMCIPILHAVASAHPKNRFIFLSNSSFQPLFKDLPSNITFYAADLTAQHKGIKGLYRLFNALKRNQITHVADLHSVLRSHFLVLLFTLMGVKTARIQKGKSEKRAITRKKNKLLKPLISAFQRYQNVFEELGFSAPMDFSTLFDRKKMSLDFDPLFENRGIHRWIGIAPFAKHEGKIYPLKQMEKVVERLSSHPTTRLFLLGGGAKEAQILQQWAHIYPSTYSLVGKLRLDQELLVMSQLDVLISMDSANMHLASLVQTPVVSIWGATHPYTGFMGWNQSIEHAIQLELPCRPCSVFGNKTCFRNDYACLQIAPELIVAKIETILHTDENCN